MSIEIHTTKSQRDGYKCTSTVPIADSRVLKIITSRDLRGVLATRVIAMRQETRGGVLMEIWAMVGDFSSTIAKSAPKRVTAAVAEDQHRAALANIDAVKAEAELFYASKAADPRNILAASYRSADGP